MFSLSIVSSGTLKTDDLLEAFAWELESRKRNCASPSVRELIKTAHVYATMIREDHLNDDGIACASELVSELEDALTELAPEYVCFGAHEGDGACFGFWPLIDSLEEDAAAGEVLKLRDTGDMPIGYAGLVMQVSDHGNVTLYSADNGKLTELWSCV